jgi:hypothetical protein
MTVASLVWLSRLVPFVAMIGILHAFSAPGGYFPESFFFLSLTLLLCAIWPFRIGPPIPLARQEYRLRSAWTLPWRRWIAGPVMVCFTLSMLYFQVPLRLRFAMSRDALNRVAQSALADGIMPPTEFGEGPIQRAGAFDVVVVEVTNAGEVDFRVPGTYFMRSFGGFAYDSAGKPDDPEGTFEPLGGKWYEWHHTW